MLGKSGSSEVLPEADTGGWSTTVTKAPKELSRLDKMKLTGSALESLILGAGQLSGQAGSSAKSTSNEIFKMALLKKLAGEDDEEEKKKPKFIVIESGKGSI